MKASYTRTEQRVEGQHQRQPVAEAGAPLHRAKAAMIMVHGRGARAEGILSLADDFAQPDVAYVAPQAGGYTWYPYSFLAPIEQNEPGLSSGIQAIRDIVQRMEDANLPPERIVLLGFSQGACLTLECAARHTRRYGGVVAFSGGLIGTAHREGGISPHDKLFTYEGSLAGTPVFLGCSDVDSHIPLARVHETTRVMRALGGDVTERIYEGMGHTINQDEISFVRGLLSRLVSGA